MKHTPGPWSVAIITDTARWHPFIKPGQGEVVIDGLRYSTQLDAFGVPMLHAPLRSLLLRSARRDAIL